MTRAGRSSSDVLVSGPQSLSIALGAALVAVVDFRVLVAAMTVGILLSAVWLGTRPEQRRRAAAEATPVPVAATAS